MIYISRNHPFLALFLTWKVCPKTPSGRRFFPAALARLLLRSSLAPALRPDDACAATALRLRRNR